VKIRENAPVSPEVVVAVLSLPTAVLAAAMSTWSARHVRRYETRMESEQKAQTKAEQAEAILSRYREPLLGAAHNLQSRLYNAVQNGFLARYLGGKDPERARCARDHTAYVLAEYLCWAEIIRRTYASSTWVRCLVPLPARFASLSVDTPGWVPRSRRLVSDAVRCGRACPGAGDR
jgi:hypothetical protein